MTDIDKLIEISHQRFNDKIDSYDQGFSLTKMFKKDGLLNSTIKGMMMFSLSIGAFANIKNVHANEMIQSQPMVETEAVQNVELFNANKLDTLTPEIMKNIANNEISGIWKMDGTENPVIILNKGQFEGKDNAESLAVQAFLIKHDFDIQNPEVNPNGYNLYGTDVKVINLNKSFFNDLKQDEMSKYPLLKEFQNEFMAHHEHDHVGDFQLSIKKDSIEVGRQTFPKAIVMEEISSDIYAILTTAKTNHFSNAETLQLFKEVSQFRTDGFNQHLDIGHATHIALNPIINQLESHPELIDAMQKANNTETREFAADFAFKTFQQLDKRDNVTEIKNEDFEKDLEVFFNNGGSIDLSKSSLINNLDSNKDIDMVQVLKLGEYESILNNMAKKKESNPEYSFKDIVKKDRKGRHYARGLTQLKKVNDFETDIVNHDELNESIHNAFNKHLNDNDNIKKHEHLNSIDDNPFTNIYHQTSENNEHEIIQSLKDEVANVQKEKAFDCPFEEQLAKEIQEMDKTQEHRVQRQTNNKYKA